MRNLMAAERMRRLQCRMWQRLLERYRMTCDQTSDDASVAQTRGSAAAAQERDVMTSLGSSEKTTIERSQTSMQCEEK
jgi:hypothetical protein